MLVCNVELWPMGSKARRKSIATLMIANVTPRGPKADGNDYVWVLKEPKPLVGKPIEETGAIREYERGAPVVDLVSEIFWQRSQGMVDEEFSEYESDVIEHMKAVDVND